jgi:hypothetical protein
MLAAFTSWLLGWASYLGITCLNYAIDFLQVCFDGLCAFAAYVVGLFPDCVGASCMETVTLTTGAFTTLLIHVINWLFPVSFFVSLINFTTCGLMALIVIMPVARWLKLIT